MNIKGLLIGSAAALACIVGVSASAMAAEASPPNMCMAPANVDARLPLSAHGLAQCDIPAGFFTTKVDKLAITDTLLGRKPNLLAPALGGQKASTQPKYGTQLALTDRPGWLTTPAQKLEADGGMRGIDTILGSKVASLKAYPDGNGAKLPEDTLI